MRHNIKQTWSYCKLYQWLGFRRIRINEEYRSIPAARKNNRDWLQYYTRKQGTAFCWGSDSEISLSFVFLPQTSWITFSSCLILITLPPHHSSMSKLGEAVYLYCLSFNTCLFHVDSLECKTFVWVNSVFLSLTQSDLAPHSRTLIGKVIYE